MSENINQKFQLTETEIFWKPRYWYVENFIALKNNHRNFFGFLTFTENPPFEFRNEVENFLVFQKFTRFLFKMSTEKFLT